MVIITMAEMLVTPTGQAIVAKLSPEDMRGRYMAVFGFTWSIPTAIGPLAAGLIMDNYNPNWVWYTCGISMLLSASIFAGLQLKASERFAAIIWRGTIPGAERRCSLILKNIRLSGDLDQPLTGIRVYGIITPTYPKRQR